MVADKDQGMVFNLRYVNITGIHAQGDTLSLHANAGERIREYKMLPETAAKMAQAALRETGMDPREDEMEVDVELIGDEDLNEKAMGHINKRLRDDETPIAVAGFDYETKVIAITDQRVIIASGNDGLALNLWHDEIRFMKREDRTLGIMTMFGIEHKHRFGKDETVQELVETARRANVLKTPDLQRPHSQAGTERCNMRGRKMRNPLPSRKGSGSGKSRTGSTKNSFPGSSNSTNS